MLLFMQLFLSRSSIFFMLAQMNDKWYLIMNCVLFFISWHALYYFHIHFEINELKKFSVMVEIILFFWYSHYLRFSRNIGYKLWCIFFHSLVYCKIVALIMMVYLTLNMPFPWRLISFSHLLYTARYSPRYELKKNYWTVP